MGEGGAGEARRGYLRRDLISVTCHVLAKSGLCPRAVFCLSWAPEFHTESQKKKNSNQ